MRRVVIIALPAIVALCAILFIAALSRVHVTGEAVGIFVVLLSTVLGGVGSLALRRGQNRGQTMSLNQRGRERLTVRVLLGTTLAVAVVGFVVAIVLNVGK